MLCPKCAKEINAEALRCPNCSRVIKIPTGINAVSIIQFIMGGLACVSGLITIAMISRPQVLEQVLTKVLTELAKRGKSLPQALNQGVIIKFALVLGIVMIVWGAIDIIIGKGLRNLKKWAGIVAIVSSALGIFVGFGRDLLGFVLNLLIIILIVAGWNSLS